MPLSQAQLENRLDAILGLISGEISKCLLDASGPLADEIPIATEAAIRILVLCSHRGYPFGDLPQPYEHK